MKRFKTKLILILILACLAFTLFGCTQSSTFNIVFIGQGYEIEFANSVEVMQENNIATVRLDKTNIIKFSIIIKDGYKPTNLLVKANGNIVEKSTDDTYSLVDVNSDFGIEVSGIEKLVEPEIPDVDNPEVDEPTVPPVENPDNPSENPDGEKPEIPDVDEPTVPPVENPDNPSGDPDVDEPTIPPIEKPDIYYNVLFSEHHSYNIISEIKDKVLANAELSFEIEIKNGFSARDIKVYLNEAILEAIETKDNIYKYVVDKVSQDITIMVENIKEIATVEIDKIKGATVNNISMNDELLVGDEYKFTLKIDDGYKAIELSATAQNTNILKEFNEVENLYYFTFVIKQKISTVIISGIKQSLTIEFPTASEYYIVESLNLSETINKKCEGIFNFSLGEDISFCVRQLTERKIIVNINGIPYLGDESNEDNQSAKFYLIKNASENIIVTIIVEDSKPEIEPDKEIVVEIPSFSAQSDGKYVIVNSNENPPKEGERYSFCIDFKEQNPIFNEVFVIYGSENELLLVPIRKVNNTYYYETKELFSAVKITVVINKSVEIEFIKDKNIIVYNVNDNILEDKAVIKSYETFKFFAKETAIQNNEQAVNISLDNGITYSEIFKDKDNFYTINIDVLSSVSLIIVKITYVPEEVVYNFSYISSSYTLKNGEKWLFANTEYKITSKELSFVIYENYKPADLYPFLTDTNTNTNKLLLTVDGKPCSFTGQTKSDFYVDFKTMLFYISKITGDVLLTIV